MPVVMGDTIYVIDTLHMVSFTKIDYYIQYWNEKSDCYVDGLAWTHGPILSCAFGMCRESTSLDALAAATRNVKSVASSTMTN